MTSDHQGPFFLGVDVGTGSTKAVVTDETGAVLEFENEIDGIKLNGVDIITFDGDGRITHFKVMVRPLKAINLLHRMMGEELMNQSGATSQSQSR